MALGNHIVLVTDVRCGGWRVAVKVVASLGMMAGEGRFYGFSSGASVEGSLEKVATDR